MNVESLLKKRPRDAVGISNTATVQECVALLVDENLGALIVYDANDKAIGIITERDIIHGLVKWGSIVLNRYVTELMTPKFVTCRPRDTLKQLMSVMMDRGFRHLPVVQNDEVIGMISIRDLVRERISEMELETNVLRDLAATHSST